MDTADAASEQVRAELVALRARVAQLEGQLASATASRAALPAGAGFFSDFMTHSPCLAWIVDEEGRLLYANDRYFRILGRSPEDIIGKPLPAVAPPAVLQQYLEHNRQVLEQDRPLEFEETYPRLDGTVGYGLAYKFPLRSPSGQRLVGGIGLDITERKRAEQALQESQHFVRRAADIIPVILHIFDPVNLRTVWANREAITILGYSPDQLRELGSDILPHLLHPEDLPRLYRHLQQVRELGDAQTATLECRVRHADGGWRWLDCRSAVLQRDENGTVTQLIGAALDITDRKRAEEALRASQRFAQSLADISPVVLCIYDLMTQSKTYVSPSVEEALGYTAQQVLEMGPRWLPTLLHPEDLERFPALLARLERLGEHESASFEYRLRHADGSWRWLYSRYASYQRSPGGAVTQVLGAALDITERKAAEEERRRLEARIQHSQKLESLGVLAGGIAHDFNNLLTGVLGNASLALRDLPVDSPTGYAVKQIEIAALRAAELTQQMLAYSGKGRFVVEPLQLSRVVEEIMGLLRSVISKKAMIHLDLSPTLPLVNADATQVRQVLMNLITNASDAIGETNGVLAVRTGVLHATREYLATCVAEDLPEGAYVFVEVADTGCGMSRATLQRIFDPFFTTKFTGRGLGLAAVLGIMRGHHGTIKIESEPEKGTTFKVLFPCSPAPAEVQGESPTSQPAWHGSGTVLLVDDAETVRIVARRILESAGFTVLVAANGAEGLDLFRRHGAEVGMVLLDLTMPHLSGEEVYRALRLLSPEVRVVLMSGYNEQEVTSLFAGKGLAGFLQKPFRADDLLAAVQRTLERP